MTPEPAQLDLDVISEQLLVALREHSGVDDLAFAQSPQQITGGYETLTYGFTLTAPEGAIPEQLDQPLILRIFDPRTSRDQGRREAAFQNTLNDLGYPVPAVVFQSDAATEHGIAGRSFNVMERIEGRPLMDEVSLDPAGAQAFIDFFARIHTRLHEVPSAPVIEAVRAAGFAQERFSIEGRIRYMDRYFEDSAFDALRPGHEWLLENRPDERDSPSVCHGDFHPGNIMVKGGEVTGVIDWPAAAFADPEFDVATTMTLIRVGAGQLDPGIRPMVEQIAGAYLERYRSISELDMDKVDYYQALRCFRAFTRGTALGTRGVDPTLVPRDQYLWASEYSMRQMRDTIKRITGNNLPLPEGK